jgi:hypothetical protein
MPPLIRLYITQTAIGFAISAVFTALVVAFDIAHLGYLISSVDGGWLAAFLFFMLNGIVFAGVQFGIAVMRMAGRQDDSEPPRGRGILRHQYATVPVVDSRRERR